MTQQDSIAKTQVPDDERLDFLPEFVGAKYCLLFETLVYDWLKKLSPDYKGGFWIFWSLSNGGLYMAPKKPGNMKLAHADNHFEGEMSADAAGIVATLYALSGLSFRTVDDVSGPDIAERYHALYEFACEHAESQLILGAID